MASPPLLVAPAGAVDAARGISTSTVTEKAINVVVRQHWLDWAESTWQACIGEAARVPNKWQSDNASFHLDCDHVRVLAQSLIHI